jgi:hypothetical protein
MRILGLRVVCHVAAGGAVLDSFGLGCGVTEDVQAAIRVAFGGPNDPFLDLAQLSVWICRDAAERDSLLERYLQRSPTGEERERARHTRVLALAFYAAAFHLVSAFARVAVTPSPVRLDELFTRLAFGRLVPNEMAAALVNEMRSA